GPWWNGRPRIGGRAVMADPEGAPRPIRVRLFAALHHFLLAATIASVTLLLQQIPKFTPFDLASRGLVSYVQAELDERERGNLGLKGYQPTWDPDAAEDRPLVIFVNNMPAQAYDARLQPMQLAAELIWAAAQQKPKLLAVAFDLDPYLDDPLLNRPECNYPIVPVSGQRVVAASLEPCSLAGADTDVSRQYVARALQSRASLRATLEEVARDTTLVVTAPPLPLTLRAFDEVVRRNDPVGDRILLRRVAWTAALCDMPDVHVALRLPERGDALTFVRNEP